MKRLPSFLLIICVMIACHLPASAQLVQGAKDLLHTFIDNKPDSAANTHAADTLSLEEMHQRDSLLIVELQLRLQESKMSEMVLRSELSSSHSADSARRARLRLYIDSVRAVTDGVPVVVASDTLFTLYANRGGYSAVTRADMIVDKVTKIGKSRSSRADSIQILDNEGYIDVMYGNNVIVSITDMDALWEGCSRQELADRYAYVISTKIKALQDEHSFWQIVKRALLFVLVFIIQYVLFKLTNRLFRKLRRKIIRFNQQRLKPVFFHDYELLTKRRIGHILIFFSNIVRYLVLLIQLTISVPILFAIFPQTEKLAVTTFHYIVEPVKMVAKAVVEFIPNLFIILVIYFCIRYIVKGFRFIANEISSEKLKISGFYPDWAKPTFNIIRFLLYAFMIAMIYPYLPGSDSGVFQGISVFVGIIISLGSSTVIGNVIAGMVITYMRPFKLGDRIKLDATVGNVIEKTPFVTRLRTPKNEVVTIPNSFIMSSHTVNYSASARSFGLIIHTTVTIGYDAPWRQVHDLLITAATKTPGVLEDPRPFVLETELQDYYPCYQINAYIKDADDIGQIYSDLHQNIQDTFNEAGVEIMSPHYYAGRDGNPTTIPAQYHK